MGVSGGSQLGGFGGNAEVAEKDVSGFEMNWGRFDESDSAVIYGQSHICSI
jgi:hypothetical protein